MKKNSKILLSCGISACMLSGLFATPTSTATKNIFKTVGDKYMDVLRFSEVSFDNLFTTLNISSSYLSGGAAWNVGDLYMAAQYEGNFLGGTVTDNTTVTTVQKEGSGTEAGTVAVIDKTKTETKTFAENYNSNTFRYFIGIGDLGIRSGFNVYGQGSWNNGTGDVTYEETGDINDQRTVSRTKYRKSTRSYAPYCYVGLPINIGDTEIAMQTGLYYRFSTNKESTNTKTYTWYNNEMGKDPVKNTTTVSNNSYMFIEPYIKLEAFDAGFSYEPYTYIYNKGFKGADGKRIGTVGYTSATSTSSKTDDASGIVTNTKATSLDYQKSRYSLYNYFNVWYGKTKDLNEKLSLGFKASSQITLNLTSSDADYKAHNATTVTEYNYENAVESAKNGNPVTKVVETTSNPSWGKVKTTYVGVSPALNLAAQYALTPAVKLNMGFGVSGANFSHSVNKTVLNSSAAVSTTTKVTTYADGSEVKEKTVNTLTSDTRTETETDKDTFSNLSTSFSAGMSFQVTDSLLIDCSMNAGKNGISDLSTVFNNVTVAGTLKF